LRCSNLHIHGNELTVYAITRGPMYAILHGQVSCKTHARPEDKETSLYCWVAPGCSMAFLLLLVSTPDSLPYPPSISTNNSGLPRNLFLTSPFNDMACLCTFLCNKHNSLAACYLNILGNFKN